MFDMNKIGKKISSLRKEKGITQMGLADKLGISFQAVSNWERGNTMPDISKLPELAEILDVTIEELLGDERKGKIVEEVAKGDISNVEAVDLADLAPIVSNEQFRQAYEQTTKNNDGKIDIDAIISIAPFLDEDVLYEFVKNNLSSGISISECVELAPFMNEKDLGELVNNLADQDADVDEIVELAPFSKICQLAPFMSDDDINRIVRNCVKNGVGFSEISSLAPFADEDVLTDLARDYLKKGGSFDEIASVAPFLDMNRLFRDFYKK